MGSHEGEARERPVHEVAVTGFCLDVTEVTVQAYAECVRGGLCSTEGLDCPNGGGTRAHTMG